MLINQVALLIANPIDDMINTKEKNHGVSHGLSEAGYDVRIKQDVTFIPGDLLHIHGHPIQSCGTIQILDPNGDSRIEAGKFCLASTIERFEMPRDLTGIVHDKSTWAREGLSVFNTVIEPGWSGYLTLELVYHGHRTLHIPAGAGIAQVLFHTLKVPVGYTGKYQDQPDMPVMPIRT